MRVFVAATLGVVSFFVFWRLANDWMSEPETKWTRLLPAAAIDAVALLSAVLHWPS
jgi:hypothetical protein